MSVTIENSDALNAVIKVSLKSEDYLGKVESKLKEHAKNASMKGFRKGKVPFGMVKKMYGKQVVFEEINASLSNALEGYIQEEKLDILGEPMVDQHGMDGFDFENPGDLTINYEVGLSPTIKVGYKAKVEKYEVEFTDEAIETMIDDMLVKYGKVVDAEEITEAGAIELEFTEMDKEEGITSSRLVLVKDLQHAPTKKKIMKLKVDESVEADIFKLFNDDKNFISQHLLGITPEQVETMNKKFTLTLKKVQAVEKSEMNNEFFDMILGAGVAKDEAEFRTAYVNKMKENYEKMADEKMYTAVVDALVESTDIPLPDEFLKRWMVSNPQNKVTQEDIDNNYEQYTKGIKSQLLLDAVLKENDLKIEGEDIETYLETYLKSSFGLPEDYDIKGDEQITMQKNQLMGNRDFINFAVEQVRKDKLTVVFNEKFKFTIKKIDAESFMKLD